MYLPSPRPRLTRHLRRAVYTLHLPDPPILEKHRPPPLRIGNNDMPPSNSNYKTLLPTATPTHKPTHNPTPPQHQLPRTPPLTSPPSYPLYLTLTPTQPKLPRMSPLRDTGELCFHTSPPNSNAPPHLPPRTHTIAYSPYTARQSNSHPTVARLTSSFANPIPTY